MKNLSSFARLIYGSFIFVLVITTSCSTDLVVPANDQSQNKNIISRTDYSGLEEQVKAKIADRDHISINDVFTYYDGTTTQGYGKYPYTTTIPTSGVYTVTGIIGDDIEGW
jgi:hypothetical protein